MTTPTIYFAANEDEAMLQVGGGTVVTTAGRFDSTIVRCALQNTATGNTGGYWINELAYSATTFWQSTHCNVQAGGGLREGTTDLLAWLDANGTRRLAVRGTGTSDRQYKVVKADNSGTETQLGAVFTILPGYGSQIDRFDVFINYAVSGQFSLYLNNVLIFQVTATDVTTNSVTSLAYSRLGVANENNGSPSTNWSELIVSDTDSRTWRLYTEQPVANGNTHNFDTGSPAASNVNEIVLSDGTFDGSTTAGQIDQYTIPSLPSGYGVAAFGVSARLAKGATGPSKMDLGVRTSGTDYWSSDQVLGPSLLNFQNWWATDPSSGLPWLGIPVNIGLKSVT